MFQLKYQNTNFVCSPTLLNNNSQKSMGYICESKQIEEFEDVTKDQLPITIKNISGLIGWYDGKDPLGNSLAPANNTPIPTWKDKSGNANDLVAKIAGTFLNNGIKFTNSWYQSIKNVTYPMDVYVVVQLPRLDVHADIAAISDRVADNFNSLTFSEYRPRTWHNGSNGFTRTANSVANAPETSTSLLVMGWSIANNNFKIYRNGVQIMSSTSYTWNAGNSSFNLGLRHNVTVPNGLLNGTIYEVFVYNRQLNDDERARVTDYLSTKWLTWTSSQVIVGNMMAK
jgi:hypothetical protein